MPEFYDAMPIDIVWDSEQNQRKVVTTSTVPPHTLVLPPCVPKATRLLTVSPHPHKVAVTVRFKTKATRSREGGTQASPQGTGAPKGSPQKASPPKASAKASGAKGQGKQPRGLPMRKSKRRAAVAALQRTALQRGGFGMATRPCTPSGPLHAWATRKECHWIKRIQMI